MAGEAPAEPAADRVNWTLPRPALEIERREGVGISRSRLSVAPRKKGLSRHTLKGRQDTDAVDRGGPRIKLFKAQAGDITPGT